MKRGNEVKATIDIEDLLVWAYRDQCVDRMVGQMDAAMDARPPCMPSVSAIMARHAALGCRVDSQPMQVAFLGAKAPDDALIVHDAVLALDDAFVEIEGKDTWLWDRALVAECGFDLEETVTGPMLVRQDGSRAALDRIVVSAEIIRHAKGAMRPDVYAEWSVGADGRVRDKVTRLRGADQGIGVTLKDVQRARARYAVWRMALMVVANDLREALARWEPTSPAAPESPWVVSDRRRLEAQKPLSPPLAKPLKKRRKRAI